MTQLDKITFYALLACLAVTSLGMAIHLIQRQRANAAKNWDYYDGHTGGQKTAVFGLAAYAVLVVIFVFARAI